MKLKKLKKINFKINNKRKIIFIIIGLSIITFGVTYGRYIYNNIKDYYLASKSFYFNSDKLTTKRAIYQVDNWSGVDPYQFTINLNNNKNNLLHANSDISYEVSYVCSTKAICGVSKTEGIIYSEVTTDYFTATITPDGVMQSGDEVWMEVIAKSTSPYKKTISARFILKVGIPGISYAIDDVSGRPYLNLSVTNTTDYYLVKESFDNYQVNQRIDYTTYMSLSNENKAKCALPLITLTFNPEVVILDMTNDAYQKAENYTTTTINDHEYINSISFRINLESSKTIKFYKASTNEDYTYPITNDESIIEFSYTQ